MTSSAESEMGAAVMARLAELSRFSEDPTCLTRRYLTDAYREAAGQVLAWMREAGMSARIDALGNVVGRYEAETPGAPALMLGSHIDTVRDAGRYDGNLGVVAAIACVEALQRAGERLPFAVEVVAFGDEEGGRFPTALTGSRYLAGRFDPANLALTDPEGISLRQALQDFGCDLEEIPRGGRRAGELLGFVELHIEQGPVLEAENLALGVVTAINGSSRFDIAIEGTAGHAGTLPMTLRRDALAGAAEMILAVEGRARAEADLVATVGSIEALPGAINVVPGKVHFTLDVRAPEDARRIAAAEDLEAEFRRIAEARSLGLEISCSLSAKAAACAPTLMTQLETALEKGGHRPFRLPSGAGHDAMSFSGLCPIAMLFQRCAAGISHNPAESVTTADVSAGVGVLLDFLRNFTPPPAETGTL